MERTSGLPERAVQGAGYFLFCYERQLKTFPELRGKVGIRFTISTVGYVVRLTVTHSSTGNLELDQCVASIVRSWPFPKPNSGAPTVVTYLFGFRPIDA